MNPTPRRGQIWDVDWSPSRGSGQGGVRPALVIQNDRGNTSERFPNTIVATISTKGRDIPFHVRLEPDDQNGLLETSWVKCEQVLTISKTRLIRTSRGSLSPAQLEEVARALKLSLELR